MTRTYTFLMIALTFISFLYLTSAESDDPMPDPATWMPDANLRTLLGVKRQTFQLAYRVNTSDLPCRVSLQMPADHVTDDSDNPNTTSNTLTVSLSSSD